MHARIFAALLVLLVAPAAAAQRTERLALMSASDVIKAKRCAPPLGCERKKPETRQRGDKAR